MDLEFGRRTVESLEATEDVLGVDIEDITKCIQKATRAVEFESTGGRNTLVRKTKEHLETVKNLR